MPSLLIIRLHPVEPVSAAEFTGYLNGLRIVAYELSFKDPDGNNIGYPPAEYNPPNISPPNPYPFPDPNTRIIQHFHIDPVLNLCDFFAVATAVIEIPDPPPGGEFKTADVRLEITRGGKDFIHRQKYYNVPVETGTLPVNLNDICTIITTSLHLTLPVPGEQLEPILTTLNGNAPNFMELRTAVENVLNQEPGNTLDIANLNRDKCKHIAYEIIWDRNAYPLPVPNPPSLDLESMYTSSISTSSNLDSERKMFEADLETYYIKHNNEADRLANYIFNLSAAIWLEEESQKAKQAVFFFPVFALPAPTLSSSGVGSLLSAGKYYIEYTWVTPNGETQVSAEANITITKGQNIDVTVPTLPNGATQCNIYIGTTSGGEIYHGQTNLTNYTIDAILANDVKPPVGSDNKTKVILKSPGPILNPVFEVPAEYFYALTANLPQQIKREQRFTMFSLQTEQQIVSDIEQAINDKVLTQPTSVNPFQAARRLQALTSQSENDTPVVEIIPGTSIDGLVSGWLAFLGEDINVFWETLSVNNIVGHFELIILAVTQNYIPLINAINDPSFNVNDVTALAAKTSEDWEALLNPNPPVNPDRLPNFTKPGTREERIQAFISHLRKFFYVANIFTKTNSLTVDPAPVLGRSPGNPLDLLLTMYPGFLFNGWNPTTLANTLTTIFPGDPVAQKQFTAWLSCIKGVLDLTNGISPNEMQFSVMEALWARGFINSEDIKNISLDDFQDALIGTVAYDYAQKIWNNSNPNPSNPVPGSAGFKPVNPDGQLVNCIPPEYKSPLGPVAYLHELLLVSPNSTCEDPLIKSTDTIAVHLAKRRGPLGNLLASQANLDVPIPLIDLVNESLEYMVANNSVSGMIYNTSKDQVGGHDLKTTTNPKRDFRHDPETLLEALPEHATSAIVTKAQTAYDKLKNDFSACVLPYSQPLDVVRTYLKQLGTTRFATMRRFRKAITEFVLDPTKEPAKFQSHLWRYPVRIETAIEYLGITPEEYQFLFQKNISNKKLHILYGFSSDYINGIHWTNIVVHVAEFLKRTCLTYCEFIELWKSEFVKFSLKGNKKGFPDCEPCCLDEYVIEFDDPPNAMEALKQLAVFIRLWRKMRIIPNARYTFTELCDICKELELFQGSNINPDFIRQLAAFQMFRDDFDLSLTDGTTPQAGETGAERLHLLALWVAGATKWKWAVEHMLHQIQQYAIHNHNSRCREPEFIKLLITNLNPLSKLAGFNPYNQTDSWYAHPTHTLRFAEILVKIYASEFNVGELLFIFSNDVHLQGDDPFPLQEANEAKNFPLGLPDEEERFSLWKLRKKLLSVYVSEEASKQWTWNHMETVLREEFGYSPSSNKWLLLGQHFFPSVLEDSGIPGSLLQRQYRVNLPASTSVQMWNTPPDGPFHYDDSTKELWTELPLSNEAVLTKISRIRQLKAEEQRAVQDLYFLPRKDLAYFAFIFNNFGEAEERLIQEKDEVKRWEWFQSQFALFYKRCQVIAEHLAKHIDEVTGRSNPEGIQLAKLLLKNLWADENKATLSWENDNGQTPPVTWNPQPNGGAFSALLGLIGTGMLAEYYDPAKNIQWREVRGGVDAFGPEKNAWNAPIPVIVPAMESTFTDEQLRFAAIRNGFAMSNTDGEMLGGAELFQLHWKGLLLIEKEGKYEFSTGSPTPNGEVPDFKKVEYSHRWRIILKRGQKTWVLLSHDWPNEVAPPACTKPIVLNTGFYELVIELERKPLVFSGLEDVCTQTTGFQLKYKGQDSKMEWISVPFDKLFQDKKDDTLQSGIKLFDAVKEFLSVHFTSTVRDIRRTYQRAFKAMLLTSRLGLSTRGIADDGQSELGYILTHPENFAGQSYYRSSNVFMTHKANFDLNFLPVLDNYEAPSPVQDLRAAPTDQRIQAMFDWWERLFDYTVMRNETQRSPEHPAWLLFHESAEMHEDKPAQLVRHLGIDLRHDCLVLQYYAGYEIKSVDLEDDRWAVRVWQAEKWIRSLQTHFYEKDIREARPDLWASDDPAVPETAFKQTDSGNLNLTRFYREGCIENHDPRRYEEIKSLNDDLRLRGRAALVAYLTHMDRVLLPWGVSVFATEVKHLSELLLIDVEVGICEKASRIEEAVSAIELFIQRARLGLEPSFIISKDFKLAWDRHFAKFCIWKACKRKVIYRENWIEWEELEKAKKTEAYQFLESELREASLTIPIPGGLAYWNGPRPPIHPGITLLQHREASTIQFLDPAHEGLGLMGTPDRHARPTWLAPVRNKNNHSRENDHIEMRDESPMPHIESVTLKGQTDLPMWLQAAVRLGTEFCRVAAAGIPPANTNFDPKCGSQKTSICCDICGKRHEALMDEYYFWLEDSRFYDETIQNAEWGAVVNNPLSDWHRPEKLPGLLNWESKPHVYLRWSRVHNGEFQQPRRSYEGVTIKIGATPELKFSGRFGDSLQFEISGGEDPVGYVSPPPPGFRYDIATDEAIPIPTLVSIPPQKPVGGLTAFPFFAWFDPGAPLLPSSMFSPVISVARHLRAHCHFEDALNWYEVVYNPLQNDNSWITCNHKVQPGHPKENCCCASNPVSNVKTKERALLLQFLETLQQWGDALMRKKTPESFQQARLIFDTMSKILGAMPTTIISKDEDTKATTVAKFKPDCAPINPRLMCLYTTINDRLGLIHSCLNAKRFRNGRPNLDMTYFGDCGIRDCWKDNEDFCADENEWCLLPSPYRFVFLIQKAHEAASDVRALGAALLAAYEKGDAEYLATMRSMHERQLLNLGLEVSKNQWREADWQVQALQKTKQITQNNLQYYEGLIANGLISGEAQYEPLTISSTTVRSAGNIVEGIGQMSNITPDLYLGFPVTQINPPPGTKMGLMFSAGARIANTAADILNTIASLGLTKAGWERRKQEWKHQVDVLTIEIEQIERQILAAERHRSIALRELNNHQQQLENAAEVHDFLRDKFTNHALYLWMQQETAALYYQMYELALHYGKEAQRAFNFECGNTARKFIPEEIWDNLHEGLLSGERLQLSLRQMENVRGYELTKHISLRLHFPMAFLKLQTTGACEIDIPEWLFDLDYPGHYMRRIKNVTMTIPCVAGPYTGVHCRLTLLSSKTRVDPRLLEPPHTCCHDERWKNGYKEMPEDTRFVPIYGATEAIATSSGQNDSGMFELNFRDERYLPFEFSGAVSRWRIELPLENNQFDMETLSDLILHLNFTAREGGENLRKVANEDAQQNLPGEGVRYFDVKREFTDAWHQLTKPMVHLQQSRELGIRLSKNMFPYMPRNKIIAIKRIEILIEAKGADPSKHHIVEFLKGHHVGQKNNNEKCNIDVHSIACVADADWPGLFHGVLELEFDQINSTSYQDLGVFRLPLDIGEITDFYLFCGYKQL
ncbi:neuraminidase-like domain-containing protein [Neobacillus vireti]|uniref:Tc toxin subunit A-related protein n=1 Tax=Neobacillus vireti TaxID=220686 RepID=UPI00300008D1